MEPANVMEPDEYARMDALESRMWWYRTLHARLLDARAALVALGYKPPEVTRLLKAVDEPGLTTTEIIRRALRSAAKA